MRVSSLGLLVFLLSVLIVSQSLEKNKTERAVKSRLRSSQSSWRMIVNLAQQQAPMKADVQKAWEEAISELAHTDVQISYVETKTSPPTGISQPHPTSMLNKFCTEVKNGKVVLSLIIGGGSAARFLITAAASMHLPTLWIPFSHRDFLRQGIRSQFESRLGSTSVEMGAAAAALMQKAHWHAFTLLIDTSLLPIERLIRKDSNINLTPRTIIHLPTNERTLKIRLQRIAEDTGRGGVLVMGCDLSNARKIITLASKVEMLAGRFLWLWLDLKSELRSNEPNVISGTHLVYGSRADLKSNDNASPLDKSERGKSAFLEKGAMDIEKIANFASDAEHRIRNFRWWQDLQKGGINVRKRETKSFLNQDEEEENRSSEKVINSKNFMPIGMLALRPATAHLVGGTDAILARMLRETAQALDKTMVESKPKLARFQEYQLKDFFTIDCLASSVKEKLQSNEVRSNVSAILTKNLRDTMKQISRDKAEFHLMNLQGVLFPGNKTILRWTKVGSIRAGKDVRLDTIVWPGGGIVPAYLEQGGEKIGMPSYRIVTALASPFVMVTALTDERSCIRGLFCRGRDNQTKCCYGLTIDLLSHVSQDLGFRFDLHIVKDGLFGKRNGRGGTWNGIIGELTTGQAQMAFAALSVSSRRAAVVDFTTPYFFSGVSFLSAPKERSDISLLAFLQPFSPTLWIAVFTSLNITAMAVAIYEWFSPFGLNPWGRQRSKNFSIASALWVMWGLLCGHLVAFKAPKSWPNKFLINIWGGFSVIFVASYTANIAALIAGLFFHSTVNVYDDRSLLTQKVGAPRASVAEHYVQKYKTELWSHMSRYSVSDVEDGVEKLKNGTLDILIADTPILDYYRATDSQCQLQKIGDTLNEDTYAIALTKGHPLRESISKVIANYRSTGLIDILQEKWYDGLPCIRGGLDLGIEHGGQPRPLGVASVAGVFCMLGLGMAVGTVILIGEHLFYKFSLPKLRHMPKTSVWRSRNVMFFSQKLYRFINCVDLVSPHHAARELVHTVRQGQITSLFQKSVKRKEHEQRRRRKSKAQFFEMIQEIRRAQQEVKSAPRIQPMVTETICIDEDKSLKVRERSRSKSPLMLTSPKRTEKSKSSTNLSGSRLGLSPLNLEAQMKPREFTLSSTNLRARSPLETVGRRLSHGDGGGSPPMTISSNFGGSANFRPVPSPRGESTGIPNSTQSRSPAKRGLSFPVFAILRPPHVTGQQLSRSPLFSPPSSELTLAIGRKLSREWGSGLDMTRSSEALPSCSSYSTSLDPTVTVIESTRRKKSLGDNLPVKTPIRRARSHETREKMEDLPSPRLMAQPVIGGASVSAKAKKQLESELKAILTARAHHFELHPP